MCSKCCACTRMMLFRDMRVLEDRIWESARWGCAHNLKHPLWSGYHIAREEDSKTEELSGALGAWALAVPLSMMSCLLPIPCMEVCQPTSNLLVTERSVGFPQWCQAQGRIYLSQPPKIRGTWKQRQFLGRLCPCLQRRILVWAQCSWSGHSRALFSFTGLFVILNAYCLEGLSRHFQFPVCFNLPETKLQSQHQIKSLMNVTAGLY